MVRDLTGGLGVDVAIEAAGSARAVEEALDLIRDGGRYVIAGHYTDAGPSAINVHQQINRKHLEIRGCWGSEVVALRPRAARPRAASRRDSLARDRREDLRALGTQSGARRRRGDASPEGSCQTQLTRSRRGPPDRRSLALTPQRGVEIRIALAALGFRVRVGVPRAVREPRVSARSPSAGSVDRLGQPEPVLGCVRAPRLRLVLRHRAQRLRRERRRRRRPQQHRLRAGLPAADALRRPRCSAARPATSTSAASSSRGCRSCWRWSCCTASPRSICRGGAPSARCC